MNFVLLGDGPEEKAWALAIANSSSHRCVASFPPALDDSIDAEPAARDLEDALAKAGVEAALIGGEPEFRCEALRRAAAEGLPAICLHPPGPDSEAYYQVAMSRAETGAVIVPDLAARLHPAVVALRDAITSGFLGAIRTLKYEETLATSDGDLVREAFAKAVDVVRCLVGEIAAVNATGDPPGDRPASELVVQLRGQDARRAEVRLTTGAPSPAVLKFTGTQGSATLNLGKSANPRARLSIVQGDQPEVVREFDEWDARSALLSVFDQAAKGLPVHPDLVDGTRAMEISEAVARSLRRGRTVELHYEEISEQGTFKSVMTSVGCLVLMSILFVLPLALAGPALGMTWTIYIAYIIPPVLIGFILMQLLRFATRGPATSVNGSGSANAAN